MTELPHPWGTYARLQKKLARSHYVDDRTWGLEAGLNRLLAEELPAEEDVDRVVRSESRKERYRTRLRRVRLAVDNSTGNLEDLLDARLRLRLVEAQVTSEEWAVLRAVGDGCEYKEIAATAKVAAGTLRARVFRLRRILAAPADNRGRVRSNPRSGPPAL